MSDHTNWRRFEGKKHGRTWNHGRKGDKASRSEGREPFDCVKQAWRAPLKQELLRVSSKGW